MNKRTAEGAAPSTFNILRFYRPAFPSPPRPDHSRVGTVVPGSLSLRHQQCHDAGAIVARLDYCVRGQAMGEEMLESEWFTNKTSHGPDEPWLVY